MALRDKSAVAFSNSFLTMGTAAFLAAFSLFFAGSAVLQQINSGSRLLLDPKPWSWMSEIRLGVASVEPPAFDIPAEPMIQFRPLVVAAKKVRRRAHVVKDVIASRAAAPILLEPSAKVVEPSEASVEEALTIQRAYKSMLSGFRSAVREQEAMSTQVVYLEPEPMRFERILNIQPEFMRPSPAKAKAHVVTHLVTKRTLVAQAPPLTLPLIHEKAIEIAAPAPVVKPLPVLSSLADLVAKLAIQNPTPPVAKVQVAADSAAIPAPIKDEIKLSYAAPMNTQAEPPPQIEKEEEPLFNQQVLVASAPTINPDAIPTKKEETEKEFSGFLNGSGTSLAGGYSFVRPEYPAPATQVVNTQHANTPPDNSKKPPDEKHPTKDPHISTLIPEVPPEPPVTGFIEAFSKSEHLTDGLSSVLSKEEETLLGTKGWLVSKAANHWPTLSWGIFSSNPLPAIPLLSNNTATQLSLLSDVSLQTETGIIFGKVAKDWTVELSGRAERPVFLAADGATRVNPENSSEDRFFAFVNVSPGAQTVVLRSKQIHGNAAIDIPVLSGMAHYLDLTQVHQTRMHGMVLDGSMERKTKVSGIQVRVVGQAAAISASDVKGRFTIEGALTVGDFPIFLEADGITGYVHRYRFSAGSINQELHLFRFAPEAIQVWLDQLSGGVSALSGLVLTALPELAKKNPRDNLYPTLLPLGPNPNLTPEVYSISSEGQLQVQTPLSEKSPMFIAAQVPEGPAISQVNDLDHRLIWSQITMIQPKVINVLGEY